MKSIVFPVLFSLLVVFLNAILMAVPAMALEGNVLPVDGGAWRNVTCVILGATLNTLLYWSAVRGVAKGDVFYVKLLLGLFAFSMVMSLMWLLLFSHFDWSNWAGVTLVKMTLTTLFMTAVTVRIETRQES